LQRAFIVEKLLLIGQQYRNSACKCEKLLLQQFNSGLWEPTLNWSNWGKFDNKNLQLLSTANEWLFAVTGLQV